MPVLLKTDKNVDVGTAWGTEMTDSRENQKNQDKESEEIQVQSISRDSISKRADFKVRQDVQPGSQKSCCNDYGKNFKTVDFQEVTRPESRSRSSFVKLWAPKETNEKSPKRIKVQLDSLSCKDTINILEVERTREIGERRGEHEKQLGSALEKRVPKETRDRLERDVQDNSFTEDKGWCNDRQNNEAKPANVDNEIGECMEERGRGGPTEVEEKTMEEDNEDVQFREQNPEKREDLFGDMTCQQAKVKENAEARESQAEARAKLRAEREDRVAETLRSRTAAVRERRARARAEAEAMAELKKTDLEARFERVERKEREKEMAERKYEEEKSFRVDKLAGAGPKHLARSPAEARIIREEEEDDVGKKLQKRARYHFEALRRIEESYIQRQNIYRENAKMSRTRYPNQSPLNVPRYWDNDKVYSSLHETKTNPLRNVQRKGKCGLSALLAPVVEANEFDQQFEDMNDLESPPESSYIDNNVQIFQKLKKAQLKAAEEQRAAAEAKAKQRKAQLKAAVGKAEKARALARESDVKEIKRAGEYVKPTNNNESVKERPTWLGPDARPSNFQVRESRAKRIKELNEKARAEEEIERERRTRLKEAEDRRARLRMRKIEPTHRSESVELYRRLNNPKRKGGKSNALTPELNSRFKSPHANCESQNYSRFSSPLHNTQNYNNRRFRCPQSGPIERRKSEALDHIATWEKELNTAQRSKSRSKEKRVTIQEDPIMKFMKGEKNNPGLKSRSTEEKGFRENDLLCDEEYDKNNKSPKRYHSPLSTGGDPHKQQPKPDHYNSVEDEQQRDSGCRKENTRETTKGRAPDEQSAKDIAKGPERREKIQKEALNWLGKFYSTITSLT